MDFASRYEIRNYSYVLPVANERFNRFRVKWNERQFEALSDSAGDS